MDNKKKRKKGDQTTPDRRLLHEDAIAYSGGEKTHKQNWRETHASTEDIQKFLSEHVLLRHNTVTGQPEFRVPAKDEFDSHGMKYITGAPQPYRLLLRHGQQHPVHRRRHGHAPVAAV